ncbi:MAG: glycosyltransferase family 1 protein [Deltaproteobacteria bacterium]|nr:glycosyltransferase family 1 protein [Deltaproteobacteria bacterium]
MARQALFAAHPTVGHTQALRAIGKALLSRGWGVRFALGHTPLVPRFLPTPEPLRAAAALPAALARDGFEVLRLPGSLRALYHAARSVATRGYDELDHAVALFTVDTQEAARALLTAARTRPVDVFVADFALFGAGIAAEVLGVPHAAVFHSGLPFPVEGAPPFGSGLAPTSDRALWAASARRLAATEARAGARLGAARRALGLAPGVPGGFSRPYATGLNILTTFEALELPRARLAEVAAGPLLWAGPCLGDRSGDAPAFPWKRLEPSARWVYVSLGTVFNNQPAVFRAVLGAVHRAGARAVVAAGASEEAVRRVADGDLVVRFAPQLELLPRVVAMVGHGGNNSTNEALRAGCPLLVVPFGAEQVANGQRVQGLGVGEMVPPDALVPPGLDAALARVLDPATLERARALARSLPEGDGAVRAADAIEALAQRSAAPAT